MAQSAGAQYLIASLAAGSFVACVQWLTDSSSPFGFLGMLALPGYLPAALVFPEGFHSESPYGFMVLAFVFDGLLYGLVLFYLWRWLKRRRA